MTIQVSYNPDELCFQAKAEGTVLGNYPNVFLNNVPFINPSDEASTTRVLQKLFDDAQAPEGWEAHHVSNELMSSISRAALSQARPTESLRIG